MSHVPWHVDEATEGSPDTAGPQEPTRPLLSPDFDWRTKFRTDAISYIEPWALRLGLTKFAVDAFIRKPRGRDIYAACGQLKRMAEGELVGITN